MIVKNLLRKLIFRPYKNLLIMNFMRPIQNAYYRRGIFNSYCDNQISKDVFWNHWFADDPRLPKIIEILNTGLVAMSFQEAINLSRFVTRTSKLAGEIAEVGSFHGGSALIMAHANVTNRKINLFDTFTGIPESTAGVDVVSVGDVRGSPLEKVKNLLRQFNHLIEYHVGYFPDTTEHISDLVKYSLVNLDMDVYAGTLEALKYFYPRVERGGMIVIHDYFSISCPGVKKAVDLFFEGKPETIVDLWHSQVVIVKM